MSLINRIEISNFVCLFGPEAGDDEWSPQFRYNILDLNSQSTAISMPNGMGKTSLADAVIAVLSRDRTLVACTREKMSPVSCGAYSHIRVELKVPSIGSSSDMLVASGQEVPGETWVFGACGFRGRSQSITFYYYKGRLEDCPVAKIEGHKITLISNPDFKLSRENVSGLRFGVPESDWTDAMTPHFPPHTLAQMAHFQKNGGGDTASSIYNVNCKGNEKYHEAFFYSVIAPELMSGAMSDENDEGDEHYLEDTFMKSGRAYIRAKNETRRREKELERDKQTLKDLEGLSDKAEKALASGEETQKLFAKISEEAGIINQLIKRRFIGIPFTDEFPTGMIGELAKGIVVIPQTGPVIKNHILAKILGKPTGNLNRDAMNAGIESTKITQPIEIIMNSSIQDQISIDSRSGPGAKGYALNQALQLLQGRDSDVDNLRAAFQWFGSTVDTNPYRRESQALAQKISLLLSKIGDCNKKASEAGSRREELEATIKRVDSLKDAWQSLNKMGCFSDEELADPLATYKMVEEEYSDVQKAVFEHNSKAKKIKGLQKSHQLVIDEYGDEADPSVILRENNDRLTESKRLLQTTRDKSKAAKARRNEVSTHADSLLRQYEAANSQLGNLQGLASKANEFAELFGDESAAGLEEQVNKDRDNLIQRQTELTGEIDQAASLVESLQSFRAKIDDVSPSEWLEIAEEKYSDYVTQLHEAKRDMSDLNRRLNDLDNEKVSASMVAAKALEFLAEEGLPSVRLLDVIREMSLEKERERDVLSYFSALLFSPVFENEEKAANAAKILYEKDFPIPVFLRPNLIEFALRGTLSSGADGLVFDHQAGVCTRAVDCIIDPSLIEREKSETRAKKENLNSKIDDLQAQVDEVSPKSALIRLAQRAEEAEKADAESNLDRLKEEQERLERKSDQINRRASHHAILLIRSMIEFEKLGGKEHLDSVSHRTSELREEHRLAEVEVAQLDEKISTLTDREKACERDVEKLTLSPEMAVALSKAKEFLDADGRAFLKSEKDVESELNKQLELSRKRNAGEHLFRNAAEFLKTKDTDFEQIQAQIETHRNQERSLLDEAESYSKSAKGLKDKRDRLRTFESSLDFVVSELLAKHKYLRSLPEISAERGAKSDIVIQAIRFMNERGQSDDADSMAMSQLVEALGDIDIKRNAAEARRSQQRHQTDMDGLVSAIETVISQGSLSASMKTALGMNKENPFEIIAIRQRFSVNFDRSKEVFEEAKSAEERVRDQARDRLVSFCDDARDNLRLLQDILKKGEATLEVKSKVSDVDTLATVVDSMMVVIENEEEYFQKTKDGTRGEEEKYKTNLVSKIRDRIYRGIFSSPLVRIVHPDIHGGRSTSISPKMSGGQRTAVSLMVMSKLAEYSMRKESIRNASSYAGRRKAIAKGTSVLIIDGLFSNLSKPSLIKKSMASLKASRGNFQLIGLIHWPQYENNHEIFPTYIIGKEVADPSSTDGVSGFVYTEDGSTIIPPKKLGRVPGELDSVGYRVGH